MNQLKLNSILSSNMFCLAWCAVLMGLGRAQPVTAQVHNWQQLNTGYDISFAKLTGVNNHLYVFTRPHNSALIRTKDGGATWDSIYVSSDSAFHSYDDILFINDSVGFLSGTDGSPFANGTLPVVKKTVDRGLTWTKQTNGLDSANYFTHINFFDANRGMVFSTGTGKTKWFTTTDQGNSWTYVPDPGGLNGSLQLSEVAATSISGNNAKAVGFTSHLAVASSTDAGVTWTTHHHYGNAPAKALQFFDFSNGVVATHDSVFFTADGGASFYQKTKYPQLKSFVMVDQQKGFFSNGTSIHYTSDAGATWSVSYSESPAPQMLRIQNGYVFATTNGKTLLRLDLSTALGLQQVAVQAARVYPNPAFDHFYLQNVSGEAEVAIHDQLGSLVRHERLSADKKIYVTGLPAGIYTVRVRGTTGTLVTKLVKNE